MSRAWSLIFGDPKGTAPLVPRWWGLVAYALYALHAAYFLYNGRPGNLLWGCHMAALGVGTGLLLRSPVFNGLGVLSLVFGTPLWVLDFATGGEFLPTSMGTHLGGLALGIAGVRSLGIPRFTWVKLVGLTAALMYLSYLVTPVAENVNLCQGPPKGWEEIFPGYPVFGVIVLGSAALQFGLAEVVLRWYFKPTECRGLRRWVRDLHVFGLGGIGLSLLFAFFAPLAILWPTLAWRNRLSLVAGRLCSRLALYLCGITVIYEGREKIPGPAILTFNHTTFLDFLVNSELSGSRCLVFGKRSLAKLPIVGWAWALGGHPLIQRENREQWQAELDRTERLLREEGYSTMVAPEGSRSRSGELMPFKKGPFHLAVATGLPIVPVVIQGGHELIWEECWSAAPGTIRARVLPPISTEGWREETLEEHMAVVRSAYERALAEPEPAPEPSSLSEPAVAS